MSAWAVLALLAVSAPALAADGDREAVSAGPLDLAAVKVFGGGVDLAPNVRYERAIVTVSGVGQTFRLEFDKYSRPSISPFAPNGDLLADGVYTWQLDLVPDETTARKLRASAEANEGRAERPWLPKTGSFAIQGGIFASPTVNEGPERFERERAARAGNRREVAAQQFGGQVYGAEKRVANVVDSDEAAVAGGEASILKASRRADSPRARAEGARSTQTGADSDHQAAQAGASAEKALVAIPKAHEMNQQNPRPRSDGSNGRKRSDR